MIISRNHSQSGSEIHRRRYHDSNRAFAGIVDCNAQGACCYLFHWKYYFAHSATSSSYNIEKFVMNYFVSWLADWFRNSLTIDLALQAQLLPYTWVVTLAATFSALSFHGVYGNIYDALAGGDYLSLFLCGEVYPNPFVTAFIALRLWTLPVFGLHRLSFNGRLDYSWYALCTRDYGSMRFVILWLTTKLWVWARCRISLITLL